MDVILSLLVWVVWFPLAIALFAYPLIKLYITTRRRLELLTITFEKEN